MARPPPIRSLALGLALAWAASASQAAQVIHEPAAQHPAPAPAHAKDHASCSAWAVQQTGYDPAKAKEKAGTQSTADKGATDKGAADKGAADTGKSGKGKKFLGKIPVTSVIGGPKSIAVGAAAGLAGSKLAKSGGVVGDAASGAANVMSKVPIPTTGDVANAADKTFGKKKDTPPKGDAAAYEKALNTCLSGKTHTTH
jgi:hypothetical protein